MDNTFPIVEVVQKGCDLNMAITEKPWYQSSTIWINLAGLLALVLDFVVQSGKIPDADIIAILLAIINIIRRFQAPKVIEKLTI